ncbi:MAG TPA: hypothetical protein VGA56_25095 [Opitutaceae bacterium]
MNLAPFKYRRVLCEDGGPISALECGGTTVMGRRMFQANAYLSDDLRMHPRENVVYGNPDGTGTADYPSVARHKAISEALERWAYDAIMHGSDGDRYGFDVDPTSNGMAAFPGVFSRQARELARAEAAERFAVIGWWSGALDAKSEGQVCPGVDVYRLENPFTLHEIVLLHALADTDVHAYAHASGETFMEACMRAGVELSRSQFVLRRFFRRGRVGASPVATGLFERRCVHFATAEGYASFVVRISRSKWRSVEPEVVFDGEIPGPWSRYATVWRVVLRPASKGFFDNRENFFFW